jgi:hypothetical protein
MPALPDTDKKPRTMRAVITIGAIAVTVITVIRRRSRVGGKAY